MRRGSPELKMRPKNGPKSGFGPGMPQFGWFATLKLSARNWMAPCSRMGKRRASATSKILVPGPGMVSRPASPYVYGAGAEKAPVLKNSDDDRKLRGSEMDWPGTIFGRLGVPEFAKSSAK